jgi:phospholipid/cholesterol/gamma-HCH transport system substrate-binding protein
MKISNEAKVGVMITLVLVSLGVLTVKTGKFNFKKVGYQIKVHFDDIDGVNLNSPVMFNGFEVGVVEDVKIVPTKDQIKMELTLFIDERAKLREGAKAYVKNLGFMGEKYVGLTSGEPGAKRLTENALIVGETPPNMDKLLKDGQKIADQIKQITTNVNERLDLNKEKIDHIIANLDTTMKSTSSVMGSADERFKTNEAQLDEIVTHLNSLSSNLEELSFDLKNNPWKLLYKGEEK